MDFKLLGLIAPGSAFHTVALILALSSISLFAAILIIKALIGARYLPANETHYAVKKLFIITYANIAGLALISAFNVLPSLLAQ